MKSKKKYSFELQKSYALMLQNNQNGFSRYWPYLLIYILWFLLLSLLTGSWGNWDPEHQHYGINVGTWSQWDAHWYETIWREGYPKADPRALVFPPGYSLIVGFFSKISTLSFGLSALALNFFSFFTFGVIASQLLARRFFISPFVLFLLILSSPTAYFIFTPYSDVLFSFLLWWALGVALSPIPRPRLEFTLLLLLPWIRLTGFALLSWILVRRWSVIAILLSLGGWFFLNTQRTGNPFYFLDAQKLFLMPQGNFIDGIIYTFRGLWPPDFHHQMIPYLQFSFLPALYLAVLSGTGVWLLWRRQWLLSFTLFGILFMSHNQSFWRSVVRYDLPLLPCFYALLLSILNIHPNDVKTKRRSNTLYPISLSLIGLIGAFQFLLQVLFARLFHSGQWGF